MRALDRLPRRRAARAVHPLLGLVVAVTIGIIVTSGLASVARADPPPGWSGPYLEVVPDHGRPADSFSVGYWYVTTDACPYATVKLTWDGNDAGTRTIGSGCSATFSFGAAPTSGVGGHVLVATACYVDSTGTEVCDRGSIARATYVIDPPPPSLVVTPSKGLADASFKASYDTGGTDCGGTEIQFYWDGAPLDPRLPITGSCTVVMDFPAAPTTGSCSPSPARSPPAGPAP